VQKGFSVPYKCLPVIRVSVLNFASSPVIVLSQILCAWLRDGCWYLNVK